VTVPPQLGLPGSFAVQDLLNDETYAWHNGGNFVRLGPGQAHVLHAR
jgi:starch synthase (maltosyl-transferring)